LNRAIKSFTERYASRTCPSTESGGGFIFSLANSTTIPFGFISVLPAAVDAAIFSCKSFSDEFEDAADDPDADDSDADDSDGADTDDSDDADADDRRDDVDDVSVGSILSNFLAEKSPLGIHHPWKNAQNSTGSFPE